MSRSHEGSSSSLRGVKHPKLSFVRELRQGIEECFPDFRSNPYYKRMTGKEEQRLIAIQGKSDFRFYLYYRLQLLVRKLRNRH